LPCLITEGDPMLAEYPSDNSRDSQNLLIFFINIYVNFVGQLQFFLIGRAILEDLFPSIFPIFDATHIHSDAWSTHIYQSQTWVEASFHDFP